MNLRAAILVCIAAFFSCKTPDSASGLRADEGTTLKSTFKIVSWGSGAGSMILEWQKTCELRRRSIVAAVGDGKFSFDCGTYEVLLQPGIPNAIVSDATLSFNTDKPVTRIEGETVKVNIGHPRKQVALYMWEVECIVIVRYARALYGDSFVGFDCGTPVEGQGVNGYIYESKTAYWIKASDTDAPAAIARTESQQEIASHGLDGLGSNFNLLYNPRNPRQLIALTQAGAIDSWDLQSNERTWTAQVNPPPADPNWETHPLYALAIAPDGAFALFGGEAVLQVRSLADGTLIRTLTKATAAPAPGPAYQVAAVDATGRFAATYSMWPAPGVLEREVSYEAEAQLDKRDDILRSRTGEIVVWNLENGSPAVVLPYVGPPVRKLLLDESKGRLAVIATDGISIYSLEGATANRIKALSAKDLSPSEAAPEDPEAGAFVLGAAFSRTWQFAAVSLPSSIAIVNLENNEVQQRLVTDQWAKGVEFVEFTDDLRTVTGMGSEGNIYRWDLTSGRLTRRFQKFSGVAFTGPLNIPIASNADGTQLAFIVNGATLSVIALPAPSQ